MKFYSEMSFGEKKIEVFLGQLQETKNQKLRIK